MRGEKRLLGLPIVDLKLIPGDFAKQSLEMFEIFDKICIIETSLKVFYCRWLHASTEPIIIFFVIKKLLHSKEAAIQE